MPKTVSETAEDYYRGFDDGLAKGRHEQLKATGLYRVEGLRAAAALSGSIVHEATEQLGEVPNSTQAEEYTLRLAETFTRWLETGER